MWVETAIRFHTLITPIAMMIRAMSFSEKFSFAFLYAFGSSSWILILSSIANNRTTLLDNVVMREGVLMQEVVVTGLNPQYKAMSQQKNNINISNVISADQVSRFPDSNIGDALKRIPGINVQYDQGEARFGHIWGTDPDLSSVMINGARIPSAESGVRAVQLDLISSDMIQQIEVNKVVTPDMNPVAIGGGVNLVTKSQPGQTISSSSGIRMIMAIYTLS